MLPGVGATLESALARMGLRSVRDLLEYRPFRYEPAAPERKIAELLIGEEATIEGEVRQLGVRRPRRRLSLVEALVSDSSGEVACVWFNQLWLAEKLVPGTRLRARGQLKRGSFTVRDFDLGEARATADNAPVYPASEEVSLKRLRGLVERVLPLARELPDPLPASLRTRLELPLRPDAVVALHRPERPGQGEEGRRRLAFDELLLFQLALARVARERDVSKAPALGPPGSLIERYLEALPFRLTPHQLAAIAEIDHDLAGSRPMQRLLQGDVGSGKTVVALRAMLTVVDGGGQAVLLAPTEVLAQQHLATVRELLGDLGAGATLGAPEMATDVVLLTGSTPASQRRDLLDKIASGAAGVVIGTHALLDQRIDFADLGLVVVDEQHRFGVEQRNALGVRADQHPHVLVMTATPIPRSVAMTVFGDLDVSTITELPGGRADVSTTVVDQVTRPAWVDRAWQRVVEEVAQGRQAFVITPRITAKDDAGGASVEEMYEKLSSGPLAALKVGMLHGRLPADEKADVMRRFAAGVLDVLVATTVVEVGVDVPNATVMVVCDAESFGISQLHQLRGRIGRASHPGVCLLLTSAEEGTNARERLNAVASTRDGFVLSEVDLSQRREGDVLGSSQSGTRSSLRLLRVLEHAEDIALARTLAEQVVERDPQLTDPGVRDYVTQIERLAEGEWQEAT